MYNSMLQMVNRSVYYPKRTPDYASIAKSPAFLQQQNSQFTPERRSGLSLLHYFVILNHTFFLV